MQEQILQSYLSVNDLQLNSKESQTINLQDEIHRLKQELNDLDLISLDNLNHSQLTQRSVITSCQLQQGYDKLNETTQHINLYLDNCTRNISREDVYKIENLILIEEEENEKLIKQLRLLEVQQQI